jgi:hypothetical protein
VRQQRPKSGGATLIRLHNLLGDVRLASAGTTDGREACNLDVFRSALNTQESALQNLKGAETLREYVLRLLTGAKIRERE